MCGFRNQSLPITPSIARCKPSNVANGSLTRMTIICPSKQRVESSLAPVWAATKAIQARPARAGCPRWSNCRAARGFYRSRMKTMTPIIAKAIASFAAVPSARPSAAPKPARPAAARLRRAESLADDGADERTDEHAHDAEERARRSFRASRPLRLARKRRIGACAECACDEVHGDGQRGQGARAESATRGRDTRNSRPTPRAARR